MTRYAEMFKNPGFFRRKPNIKFVHDDDLGNYLDSLGIYQDVLAGRYKCMYCGTVIDMNNLEAIVPFEGKIKIICSKPACKEKYGS